MYLHVAEESCNRATTHVRRKGRILTDLGFDDFAEDACRDTDKRQARLKKHPFYRYAALNWARHPANGEAPIVNGNAVPSGPPPPFFLHTHTTLWSSPTLKATHLPFRSKLEGSTWNSSSRETVHDNSQKNLSPKSDF